MAHTKTTSAPKSQPNKPCIKAYFPAPMVARLKRMAKAKRMSASTLVINIVMDHLGAEAK